MLLQKLGAGDDVAIRSADRWTKLEPALDDLIGFFVNTLVLRTDLSGDPSVEELIARVRETSFAAYANQDLPFERLVEILNPARTQSHNPLFQVMLALQNTADTEVAMPQLRCSRVEVQTGSAKFDISFSFAEENEGLAGTIEYATDLFEESSVRAIGERLVRVLQGMVGDPQQAIGAIEAAFRSRNARRCCRRGTTPATPSPMPRCLRCSKRRWRARLEAEGAGV